MNSRFFNLGGSKTNTQYNNGDVQPKKKPHNKTTAGGPLETVKSKGEICPFCYKILPNAGKGAMDVCVMRVNGSEIPFYGSAFREKLATAGFVPPSLEQIRYLILAKFIADQVRIWGVDVKNKFASKRLQFLFDLAHRFGLYDVARQAQSISMH